MWSEWPATGAACFGECLKLALPGWTRVPLERSPALLSSLALLFGCRALAQGLSRNKGMFLGQAAEEQEAGEQEEGWLLLRCHEHAMHALTRWQSQPGAWTCGCRSAAAGCGRGAVPHGCAAEPVCRRGVCGGGGGQAAEVSVGCQPPGSTGWVQDRCALAVRV